MTLEEWEKLEKAIDECARIHFADVRAHIQKVIDQNPKSVTLEEALAQIELFRRGGK